jgi:membrane dipeptidase
VDISARTTDGHIDIPRLRQGGVALQVFSSFVSKKVVTRYPYRETLADLQAIGDTVARNADDLALVTTAGETRAANQAGKIAALVMVEGLHTLKGRLERIEDLCDRGVRIMGPTWNYSNEFATSAFDEASGLPAGVSYGLSRLGEEAVAEMERLRILIDVSHLGERAFWRLIEIAKGPIIATHSSSRVVYGHFRNLTDAQIRAVAATGGVIGVNFCPGFLAKGERANLKDAADHVERIIAVGGIDCAAVGSDFDGISRTPKGLDHVGKMQNLAAAMRARGFGESAVQKIMMGNFMRVFARVCG